MKYLRACMMVSCLILPIVAACLVGCDADGKPLSMDWNWGQGSEDSQADSNNAVASIPELRGTIGEVCSLISASETPIRAEAVVIGLVDKGSSEYPPSLEEEFAKYLKTQMGVGDALQDLGMVSPIDVLKSKDTAVVEIAAIIPPGAPKGTRLDVEVRALPQTQTLSLVGGYLLPRELQWGRSDRHVRDLKALAVAQGSVFVNPFVDATDTRQMVRLREGVILNGGVTLRDMPIRLVLHRPDYAMAQLIQNRINGRFSGERDQEIARANTPDGVNVVIPPEWRDDYEHFLQLILHLPRHGGAAIDAQAHEVARLMEDPTANHSGLALVWESIGKQILPSVQNLYTSETPAVRFYAARTGLRLGDTRVAGPIITQVALEGDGVLQLEAIRELGHAERLYSANGTLTELLDRRSEIVRIAAYEALNKRGGGNVVERYNVADEFQLDVVPSKGDYVIYATRTGKPRIVIFGRDLSLANPVFFNSTGNEVRIYSQKPLTEAERETHLAKVPESRRKIVWQKIVEAGETVAARRSSVDLIEQKFLLEPHDEYEAMYINHLCLQRRLPGTEAYSEPFQLGFQVVPLIRKLGGAPRPNRETYKIDGIGLNYGQVVGVLAELCEEGDIPAKFVLQSPPALRRIYEQAPIAGAAE